MQLCKPLIEYRGVDLQLAIEQAKFGSELIVGQAIRFERRDDRQTIVPPRPESRRIGSVKELIRCCLPCKADLVGFAAFRRPLVYVVARPVRLAGWQAGLERADDVRRKAGKAEQAVLRFEASDAACQLQCVRDVEIGLCKSRIIRIHPEQAAREYVIAKAARLYHDLAQILNREVRIILVGLALVKETGNHAEAIVSRRGQPRFLREFGVVLRGEDRLGGIKKPAVSVREVRGSRKLVISDRVIGIIERRVDPPLEIPARIDQIEIADLALYGQRSLIKAVKIAGWPEIRNLQISLFLDKGKCLGSSQTLNR